MGKILTKRKEKCIKNWLKEKKTKCKSNCHIKDNGNYSKISHKKQAMKNL